MLTDVAFEVHAHEPGHLEEARVDASEGSGVAQGHGGDDVVLEPAEWLGVGQFVDLRGIHPRIDRAGHQGESPRLRRVVVGRHQCRGGQGGGARLADGQHVHAGPDVLQVGDDLGDVIVQTEAPMLDADVACVVPVGHVHVVVGQQRAHGRPEQGGEVPGQGGHQEHSGLGLTDVVLGEVEE